MRAERDRLVAQVKAMQETTTFKLNDYDRLTATVDRVRALRTDGFDQNAAHSYVLRDNLDRALAEPEEATFPRCRECGKWK